MSLIHVALRQALIGRRPGFRWLINDNFTTDRAAGNVNGTAAEPGPGTRTVTDTESKLSISSGAAVFAGGKAVPAFSDPGLWYGAQTRKAGIAFCSKNTIHATTSIGVLFTLSTTSGTLGLEAGVRFSISGNIFAIWSGSTPPSVGTYTVDVPFVTTFVLRASGFFLFVGGKLVYISSNNSNGTLYSQFNNYDAVFDGDYIKVAQLSWLPSPLTSDGFGTAGALATTDGLGHAEGVAGGIGSGGGGKVWTGATWSAAAGVASNAPNITDVITNGGFDADTDWTKGTGWTIAAGVASHSAGTASFLSQGPVLVDNQWSLIRFTLSGYTAGGVYAAFGAAAQIQRTGNGTYVETYRGFPAASLLAGVYATAAFVGDIDNLSAFTPALSTLFATTTHSAADVLATVAVTLTIGTQAGVVVNLDSAATPANFVIAYHDGTNCKLEKCVAGTYTTVVSAAATYSAGAELRVIKDGTAYRLYYNNALVGTGTINDAGIVSNTLHGLFSTYSANTFDNFTVYPRTITGQGAALLDRMAAG